MALASLACFAATATAAVPAHADRPFTPRFAANAPGSIALAANGILSCPSASKGCPEARAATKGAQLGNNNWEMAFVDVDADPATFDSSRADLVLPSGATVLFAGLYWGANTVAGTRGKAAPDAAARDRVLLAGPGGGYTPVTANRVDNGSARSQPGAYQGFANVTSLVSAAGAGTYTVADVQSATGLDRYAGWSLVVVYGASAEPPRNLTVFDGFESVNAGDAPREISVLGFRTPGFGPVRSTFGYLAYEGDLSGVGDSASLNGKPLSDASSPANNFFNSSISAPGGRVTTKDPDYVNQLGYDANVYDTSGQIPNGATSAAIRLQTTGDTYIPGMVFTTTELFAPDLQSQKAVTDLDGGLVEPGDELEYTISGTNEGQDAAATVAIVDPLPANTELVPGSLRIGGAPVTDAGNDDQGELEPSSGQLTFRVGAGATATAGGRLVPNESYEVRYRVRVAAATPSGTAIANQARVSLLAESLGFAIETPTNATRLATSAPDLTINKNFGILAPGTFGFTIANVGDAPSRGTVVVTDDDLPPGTVATILPTPGDGWACDPPGQALRCERSDSLAAGASWPPILATVAPVPTIDTGVVSGGGDVNLSNNSDMVAQAPLPVPAPAPLGISKTVTPDAALPGEVVTYVLSAENVGDFRAIDDVQVTDALPAGLELISAEALDQGSCSGAAVTCALGTLAINGKARVRITARVGASVPPGQLENTATVSSPDPDPHDADNVATATLTVRNAATLRMTKVLEGAPKAGGPVRWRITLSNDGGGTVPGGAINDVMPTAVRNPSATVAGGAPCAVAGRLLSCDLPAVPPGGQATIEVAATLPSDAGADPLFNGVQLLADTLVRPPLPSAQTPPTDVALPAADLGIAAVATPGLAARDGAATWHLRATNHGPSDATNVIARDTLPKGMSYLRSTPARRCAAKGRTVTCRFGSLRSGRSAEADIRVRLEAGSHARSLATTISIDASQPDPAPANDKASAAVALAPRLALTKSPASKRARAGATIAYRLTLANRGPGTATNVVLCDRPGRGLALRRAPDAERRAGSACWRVASLKAGRAVVRRVVVSVTKAGPAKRANVATARVSGTRVAAARGTVAVGTTPRAGCSAAGASSSGRPLAGPAC